MPAEFKIFSSCVPSANTRILHMNYSHFFSWSVLAHLFYIERRRALYRFNHSPPTNASRVSRKVKRPRINSLKYDLRAGKGYSTSRDLPPHCFRPATNIIHDIAFITYRAKTSAAADRRTRRKPTVTAQKFSSRISPVGQPRAGAGSEIRQVIRKLQKPYVARWQTLAGQNLAKSHGHQMRASAPFAL